MLHGAHAEIALDVMHVKKNARDHSREREEAYEFSGFHKR